MLKTLFNSINGLRLKRGFWILSSNLKKAKQAMSHEEAIEFLFSKKGALIMPWQFKSEITNLFKLYEGLHAKTVLEIGTADGGTLFGHCRLADPDATLISIDLPGGQYGGGYPDFKIPIYKKFAKQAQSLHLIRADSQASSTLVEVKSILKNKELDYLFIDGDHSYAGVKKDFELYSPFVKKGGVIVFHDIVPHKHSSCKVDEFWNEIKLKFEHKEFIDKPGQDCFGVGILFNN